MSTLTDIDERLRLITRNLPKESVHNINIIEESLKNSSRKPKVLWVTSPTGKPHVGYYVPLLKFADFLKAGCEIVIVLLDVYSYLDNVHYPMEQVVQRMYYYKYCISAALESIGIPASSVTFVQESSYHFSRRWIQDQWKLCTLVPQQAVRDAWDRAYNPNILSPMFCPGIQTLAEEHLDIDFQFGGADQAGIFAFAERFLPQLGYRERGHLMNAMLPNLQGAKMSSSHPPKTKIMFTDDAATIEQKISEVQWAGPDRTRNGILAIIDAVLIPVRQLQMQTAHAEKTVVNGDSTAETNGVINGVQDLKLSHETATAGGVVFTIDASGKPRTFTTYDEIADALEDGSIEPEAIKTAVAKELSKLLEPVRKQFATDKEWQHNEKVSYPEDN